MWKKAEIMAAVITLLVLLVIGGAALLLPKPKPAPTGVSSAPVRASASKKEETLKIVRANQALINRFQKRFDALAEEQMSAPNPKAIQELENLQTKITVLVRENERSLNFLSDSK